MKMKYVLPLVIFLALAIFLMVGLNRDPREVPSPLIGKPAPEFSLPRLDDPNKVVSKKDMLGQVLAAERLVLMVRILPSGTSDHG